MNDSPSLKDYNDLCKERDRLLIQLNGAYLKMGEPIPLILTCPWCNGRHIDEGEWATRVHHTHSCQHCGMTWRPAVVATVGVQFLPGFKNEDQDRDRADDGAGNGSR